MNNNSITPFDKYRDHHCRYVRKYYKKEIFILQNWEQNHHPCLFLILNNNNNLQKGDILEIKIYSDAHIALHNIMNEDNT